jgi:hypothetical protein
MSNKLETRARKDEYDISATYPGPHILGITKGWGCTSLKNFWTTMHWLGRPRTLSVTRLISLYRGSPAIKPSSIVKAAKTGL